MSLFDPQKTNHDWERVARLEPYYGVLTTDEYHQDKLDEATFEKFFLTGEKHIEELSRLIRERLDPDFTPRRSLDFGCGVGRILIPLARISQIAVGMDISPTMLQKASENCLARGVNNVEFVRSDDRLSKLSGTFNFIHSFIVFQHIPRQRGEKIFAQLLEHLEDNGIIACQFYLRKNASIWARSANWLRRSIPLLHAVANRLENKPFSYPAMHTYPYDLTRILQILEQAGCGLCTSIFTEHHHNFGVMLLARNSRPTIQLPV